MIPARRGLALGLAALTAAAVGAALWLTQSPTSPEDLTAPALASQPQRPTALAARSVAPPAPARVPPAQATSVTLPALAPTPTPAPALVRAGRYSVAVVATFGQTEEQHGVLALGPEAAAPGGAWRAARFDDVGGQRVLGAVRLAADGTFDACRTRPSDDGDLGLRLCAATGSLTLGRAPAVDARQWTTHEGALRGWSEVGYRRDGDQITKAWTAAPGVPSLELHGQSVVTLGRSGLESVELTERGRMGQKDATLAFSTQSTTRYQDGEHGLDLAALDLRALMPPAASRGEPTPDPAPRPFEEVLAELPAAVRSDKPSHRNEVRDALTYSIRASAVAVSAARELLTSETRDDAERSVLVAALVGAETAASQAAVLELLGSRRSSSGLRVDLLNAVALMQHPTSDMAERLVDMASSKDPLAHGAAVTAGGISSRLDDAAREATVLALIAAAERILTPQGTGADPFLPNQRAGTRAAWVDALGNTADPRILPLVSESLNEPSPIVRAAAADALRFLLSPSCARIMEEAMLTEHSVHVRGRLLLAALKMGPERMGSFVERALFKDESGYVRRTAAFVAASWATTAPGYLEVLARALKEEKEPDVAEAISNHLHPNEIHGDENMRVDMLPSEDGDGAHEVEESP